MEASIDDVKGIVCVVAVVWGRGLVTGNVTPGHRGSHRKSAYGIVHMPKSISKTCCISHLMKVSAGGLQWWNPLHTYRSG